MTNAPDTVVFQEVDEVLAAACAPASPAELAGEAAALAAFRAAGPAPVPQGGSRTRWWGGHPRRIPASRLAIVAVAAFGLLGVSGAAAATGSLPGPAQDTARAVLSTVGVEVPRGNGRTTAPGQLKDKDQDTDKAARDKAANDGVPRSDEPKVPAETPAAGGATSNGQGATISSIAQDPALTGADKGAAVSDAASDGKSKAGEERSRAGQPPTGPPSSLPAGPPALSPSDTAPGRTTSATAGPTARPSTPGKSQRP